MSKPPNNIISQYDANLRRQIAVWLADGISGCEVRRRLVKLGIQRLPQDSSFTAFRKSGEYKAIYQRMIGQVAEIAAADTDWKIAESAGANGFAAAAIFETLRDLRRQYTEAAEVNEKVALAAAINSISRTLGSSETEKLKEADRSWKRQFAEQKAAFEQQLAQVREEHAAELAQKDAEIARLNERLVKVAATTGAMDPDQRRQVMDAVNEFVGGKKS